MISLRRRNHESRRENNETEDKKKLKVVALELMITQIKEISEYQNKLK
jgi:hypothetical protein